VILRKSMRSLTRFLPLVLLLLLGGTTAWTQELSGEFALVGQSPLRESIVRGTASPEMLSLSLKDAVDRAVRNNLATAFASEAERIAAAHRLEDLAELYPKIDAYASTEQRQTNLAAFGFSGFPGVRQVIGPFGLVDVRAGFSQQIIDLEKRHNLRESSETQRAAGQSASNTRELVVLTALDLYFRVASGESRVVAVQAQRARAQRLHERALDLKAAGLIAGIDSVRAEVELRSVEQRLIQARNSAQHEKLALARAIGLPLGQEFVLADPLPAESPIQVQTLDLVDQAARDRQDAKALESRVRAAEAALKAAQARRLPTVGVDADYGVIGPSPANSHGTFSFRVGVRVPLFDKTLESDTREKEADLRERQAERDSLYGRIEFEVRSALLELQSAAEQLQVARQEQALSQQQLDQAQDRFSAGVANNLEVVQAQEAVSLADETVIQGLYGFNVSRALLARATGSVERSVQEFFGGNASQ